jgi:hypothetical protein
MKGRPFPFGQAPADVSPGAPLARTEALGRPRVEHTASPDESRPPLPALPFSAPMLPPAPVPSPLVPSPPPRAPRGKRASLRHAVIVVLILHNLLVLLYVLARWGR